MGDLRANPPNFPSLTFACLFYMCRGDHVFALCALLTGAAAAAAAASSGSFHVQSVRTISLLVTGAALTLPGVCDHPLSAELTSSTCKPHSAACLLLCAVAHAAHYHHHHETKWFPFSLER
eukprot:GGOE01009664.1.p5 GENE.GGOE01009664.1~~GGOE01009664.1.p5  ORF type:complete len:121 (-),score=9.73 GGOE01009664.1:865-1227(-)